MKLSNIRIFSILALATILASCNQFKMTTTEAGDRFILHHDEAGENMKEGDIVTLELVIKSETDSVFKDTYKDGQPIEVDVRSGGFKGSFENALFNFSKGDSATVMVKADSLFSRIQQPLPPGVTPNSDLKFIVKVKNVLTAAEFAKAQDAKGQDEQKIVNDFAAKNYQNATKTETGMYHLVQSAGAGATPARGDTVVVNYKGTFLDGKTFDQSNPGQPFEFPVGMGYVIRGWDEGLLMMKKGEKAKFLMPSSMAYGPRGAGNAIPAYSPLQFDIELVDIKKQK